MALQGWDKNYREKLKIAQQETEQAQAENAQLKLMISAAKPGQSPGDDRTKEPYDKDWPPPAPLAPKLAGLRINPNTIMLPKEPAPAESDDDYGEGDVQGHPDWKLSNANNIRSFQDSGYQLNIPLHDWKQIPPAIKNDPDFIRLHLRRMQALGINPMLAGGPQLPNFKPMGRVIKGVRKGVLSPEENKIKQALQIRGV